MSADLGLLILRIVLGLYLMGHGSQKLFGWFEGPGLTKFAGGMRAMRLRPPAFWAIMAGISELGGGALTVLGLLSPLGPLGIIAAMLMANIIAHRGKGLWNTKGGRELPIIDLAAALALAFIGPGAYSVDYVIGILLPEPITFLGGLVLVILGVLAALLGRAPQAAQSAQAASAARRQS